MKSLILLGTLTATALLSFNHTAVAQAQQAAVPAPVDARQGPDGILKAQGSIHYRKGGQLTRVTHEIKLSEGIVARPDGQITLKDGKNVTLQEGQILTMDGKVQTASKATGATDTSPTNLPAKPELQDKGNEGSDLEQKIKAQKQP